MSNCRREFDKLVKELRVTTDNIMKQARIRIDNALADTAKKVRVVCGETLQNQMQDTMKRVKQETNRNLSKISKDIDTYIDDMREYTK